MRQKLFVIVLLVAVGVGLGVNFRASQTPASTAVDPELMGTVWPQPRPLEGFSLSDHHGADFGPAQLQGQWTLLFFGYTSCPDICPTTMLTLRTAVGTLVESGESPPRVVLVSVDPERDTADTLGRYVGHFNDAFVGVRGNDAQLEIFVRMAGGMFEREAPRDDGSYEVAHSASVFVVDPKGRMYAVISPPLKAAAVAEKLKLIRRHYERNNRGSA